MNNNCHFSRFCIRFLSKNFSFACMISSKRHGTHSTPCSKIFVFIYFPGKWVLKANVLSTATTKDIKQLISNEDVIFIHNGIEMIDSLPFSFYDVKERDVLVVCSKSKTVINEKWTTLAKDTDLFKERVGSIIDPKTSREVARLKDFQMIKMEKKPRAYRRLCAQFIEEEANKRILRAEQKPKHVTVVPEIDTTNSMPSSQPLPIFWTTSENVVERDPLSDLCSATTSSTSLIAQDKQEITPLRDD